MNYQKDLGLLILRVGIGVMFIFHAIPKLMGGPAGWEGLARFGLPFLPEGFIAIAFGFAAMATELVGGLLLALGKFHRITTAALAGVMLVATTTKVSNVTGIGILPRRWAGHSSYSSSSSRSSSLGQAS